MFPVEASYYHFQHTIDVNESLNLLGSYQSYRDAFLWHPYKYLVKTIYKVFFPVFVLLELPEAAPGNRAVAQRKLLHLEKLFASLLCIESIAGAHR